MGVRLDAARWSRRVVEIEPCSEVRFAHRMDCGLATFTLWGAQNLHVHPAFFQLDSSYFLMRFDGMSSNRVADVDPAGRRDNR